jgi:hypothetical protein
MVVKGMEQVGLVPKKERLYLIIGKKEQEMEV